MGALLLVALGGLLLFVAKRKPEGQQAIVWAPTAGRPYRYTATVSPKPQPEALKAALQAFGATDIEMVDFPGYVRVSWTQVPSSTVMLTEGTAINIAGYQLRLSHVREVATSA